MQLHFGVTSLSFTGVDGKDEITLEGVVSLHKLYQGTTTTIIIIVYVVCALMACSFTSHHLLLKVI